MSRAAEIQSILDDFVPRLNALRDDALQEIAEAEETAQTNISTHAQASEELVRVEARISSLSAEREALPDRAYRAGLDEDFELEDNLKDRYKNLKPAIAGLEERREALRREIRLLSPDGDDHPNNALIHQYAKVAGAAYGPRAELEALATELTKALAAAVDPVTAKHESWKGTTWQLSHDRAWAESPAGRGGIPA